VPASSEPWRPTREQVAAADDRTIADVLASGLDVLFCGINPSRYSGAVGHHFARPGNRFWRALHGAGFTDRVLSPFEDAELPSFGLGLTNLVRRSTAAASDLRPGELLAGARSLRAKVRRYKPRAVAVLGLTAYRSGFARPKASLGEQPDGLAPARLWVLPNPSGLNAHHQLPDLIERFAELRASLG